MSMKRKAMVGGRAASNRVRILLCVQLSVAVRRARCPQKRPPPLELTDELLLDPPPNEPEPESPLLLAS